ncbi:DUF2339 domain-containing protein [Flavobacterium sp. N1719]|uniref:DUF2339 domain-containing protein n=1 Tax=Flavobacterium sp. N1719 TaxID=2885633 RepID=UPI002223C616|nr:DUF2339 domain-containing protein [Flavobacterium sp. N1719]
MEVIVFLLFALVVYVLIKQQTLKSRLDQLMEHYFKLAGDRDALQQKMETLREQLEALQGKTIIAEPEPAATSPEIVQPEIIIPEEIIPEPTVASLPVTENLSTENPEVAIEKEEEMVVEPAAFSAPKVEEAQARPVPYTPPTPPEPTALSLLLKKWESQFADNWTGILGTAIMVLGVGYLSIYTALKVSPLYRVMIIWAYAGLLMGSYFFLKKKVVWEKTGLWLRSAGASLFLFGCFGASQIPALQFIKQTKVGYGLLILGIGLNLWIGYRIKKQTFLSLHVVLSMLILCVIPDKLLLTFLIAAGTATVGILLSYKEKWEYHVLTVIGAFLIFDIWFTAEGNSLTAVENRWAILSIVFVAVSCIVMQYRKLYDNSTFDKAGFITHITNWLLFTTGLLMHATGSKFKTIVLLIGAGLCFWASRVAKKRQISWLYQIDFLVSFLLLSFTVVTLNDWNVGVEFVLIGLTLVFNAGLFLTFKEQQALLQKIIKIGFHLFVALTLFISLQAVIRPNMITQHPQWFFALLLQIGLALGITMMTSKKESWKGFDGFLGLPSIQLNGIIALGFQWILVAFTYHQMHHNEFIWVLLGATFLWSLVFVWIPNMTLNLSRVLLTCCTGVELLYLIYSTENSLADLWYGVGFTGAIALQWWQPELLKNRFVVRFSNSLLFNLLVLVLIFKYCEAYPVLGVLLFFGLGAFNLWTLWYLIQKESQEVELHKAFKVFYGLQNMALLYFNIHVSYTIPQWEILVCFGISLLLPVLALGYNHKQNQINGSQDAFVQSKNLDTFLLFVMVQGLGFWGIPHPYSLLYFGLVPVLFYAMYLRSVWFEKCNFLAFVQLVFGAICALPLLFEFIRPLSNSDAMYLSIGLVTTLLFSLMQHRNRKTSERSFLVPTLYLQNIAIALLLLQTIQLDYSCLALMGLALVNFALHQKFDIPISKRTPDMLVLLGLGISLVYSLQISHEFELIQWILYGGVLLLGVSWMLYMRQWSSDTKEQTIRQLIMNIWTSAVVFSQLPQKWMPFYWAIMALLQLYLYSRKFTFHRAVSLTYFLLANFHLGILGFWYYQPGYWPFYVALMGILGIFVGYAYRVLESFTIKNSLLIYPVTLSVGLFLYLTFDKGALTFLWVLEALGLLVLSITLKEKYFRYVSLSVVGLCIVRLMFFDLSNTDFLIRALVLLGVGIVLLVMNSLFKKYKDRLD